MCGTLVGDWIINSCSNCQTDVYITHVVKADRTFVLPGVLVSFGKISMVLSRLIYYFVEEGRTPIKMQAQK